MKTSDSPHAGVPHSEAEITAAWLKKVIPDLLFDRNLDGLKVQKIGSEYGFASGIFRCFLGEETEPQSVVVKLWPTSAEAGTTEISFYQTFGREAGARVPICFHADDDPKRKRGVLVLEDLSDAVQGDYLHQLNTRHAERVAQSVGHLHEEWWEHPSLAEAHWLREFTGWDWDSHWLEDRRSLLIRRFAGELDEFARSVLDNLNRAEDVVRKRISRAPITLLHTDLHADNLLFDGGQPVLLDWARCAKGPAVLDVADVLIEMCRPEDFDSALVSYSNAFEDSAAKGLDTGSLHRQLGGAVLCRFVRSTCGVARSQPGSPRQETVLRVQIQRACAGLAHWAKRDSDLFSFL